MPTKSEITFLYSGGSNNLDPDLSLGGSPSAVKIYVPPMNNLFDDVTQPESIAGYMDFRCFYIRNSSGTDFRDVKVFINSQHPWGAYVELGVDKRNDLQQIAVISDSGATGGSFTLAFGDEEAVVAYNADLGAWADNCQIALNNLDALSGIVVTPSQIIANGDFFQLFAVSFEDKDGLRNQELLRVASNDLTGVKNISISKLRQGSPINAIPPQLQEEEEIPTGIIVVPTGVTFVPDATNQGGLFFKAATRLDPLSIGNLKPAEYAAIWAKRIVEPQTQPLERDYMEVAVRGKSSL